MTGLEAVVQRLVGSAIVGELWVNGSFLTQKIDPEDVDLALRVSSVFYDNGSPEQRRVIGWFSEGLKEQFFCDSYVWLEWPEGHPLYQRSEERKTYWMRQFGFSRGKEEKGIAVVGIPLGAV